MKHSSISYIFLLFLLAACDSGSQNNLKREALQEEMRNREPKKVSEAQITAAAFERGEFLAEQAQKKLLNELQNIMEKSGPSGAVGYCSTQALALTDSLSQKLKADIGRTSLKLRNSTNVPDKIEKQLLEAYEYNAEKKLPLDDNVQRINQNYLLYSKPIVIGASLCLRCHGEPGNDIDAETLNTIDNLYPNDKARNYKMGDFRGIWSIKMQQKDLVNAL